MSSDLWIDNWLSYIEAVEASRWPRKFKPVIKASPRVGDIYWCRFHDGTEIHLPEMWKTRPCVIVSRKNTLYGKVTVLPFSTSPSNASNPNAHQVSSFLSKKIDGALTWVLCDHVCTIATSRLRQLNSGPHKFGPVELREILGKMMSSLAAPLDGHSS